jgi:hypothetical protein
MSGANLGVALDSYTWPKNKANVKVPVSLKHASLLGKVINGDCKIYFFKQAPEANVVIVECF